MFLSILKEQIKKELKFELEQQLKQERNEIYNSIVKIISLEKKTDKEIIAEYKHDKFSDVSDIEQKYLQERYNLKILKEYQLPWTCGKVYSVWEYEYISDTIEKLYKPTTSQNECCTAYEILPTKKKRTKRKK